jgi:hypothetical protein
MDGNELVKFLATTVEKHTLQACSTEQLKAELARRGEALPQQIDLREPLARLFQAADLLNQNLNSGDYDDAVREAMAQLLPDIERALILDCGDAVRRQAKPRGWMGDRSGGPHGPHD